MPCLTAEQLAQYRSAGTTPDEMSAIDRHLAECAACRQALDAAVKPAAAGAARHFTPDPEEPACLSDEILGRYVRGEADPSERALVEAHCETCALCRTDLEALKQLRDELENPGDHDPEPRSRWRDLRDAVRVNGLRGLWNALAAGGFLPQSLAARIIIALTAGVAAGWALGRAAAPLGAAGTAIVQLLTSVALPLIFFGLVRAILRLETGSAVGRRMIRILAVNASVAAGIGLVFAFALPAPPILSLPSERHAALSLPPVQHGLLEALRTISSGNILLLVGAAVAFGISLRVVRGEQREQGRDEYRSVVSAIETLFQCTLTVMRWVIMLAPLAVFALAAQLVGTQGIESFQTLGLFAAECLLALCCLLAFYLARIHRGSRTPLRQALRGMRSAVLTAFATASSAAAVPITYARARDVIGLSEEAAGLGILIGSVISRDATALFEVMGALFIAHVAGVHPDAVQVIVMVVMAIVASACAPGTPETGLITMTLIFTAIGAPQASAYIVLLLPLDWLIDRCRSAVNVVGHVTIACLLDGKNAPQTRDAA